MPTFRGIVHRDRLDPAIEPVDCFLLPKGRVLGRLGHVILSRRHRNEVRGPVEGLTERCERLLDDRGFSRLHTYHEFSIPIKAGHLNIVPRIGERGCGLILAIADNRSHLFRDRSVSQRYRSREDHGCSNDQSDDCRDGFHVRFHNHYPSSCRHMPLLPLVVEA